MKPKSSAQPYRLMSAAKLRWQLRARPRGFNPLGWLRALSQSRRLDAASRAARLAEARGSLGRFMDFLILKDPPLAERLANPSGDRLRRNQFFIDLPGRQRALLRRKRLRSRNFGIYSRHGCAVASCPLAGVMLPGNRYGHRAREIFPLPGDPDRAHLGRRARAVRRQRRERKLWRQRLGVENEWLRNCRD